MIAEWDPRRTPRGRGPTPRRGWDLRRALMLVWALLGSALVLYGATGLLGAAVGLALPSWPLALGLALLAGAAVVALDEPPLEWDPPLERDELPLAEIAPATSRTARAEVRAWPDAPSGQHSRVPARAQQSHQLGRAGAGRAHTAGARDAQAQAGRPAPGRALARHEARERTQVEILKLERIKQLVGRLERAPAGRALPEAHVAQLANLLSEARIPQASPAPAIVREVDRRIASLHPG
jgi:hypothetical protein